MILVTGTKRSGSSMWMQILIAAGYRHFGSAFPGAWGESIRDANPAGFYESRLRQGVYWATNPDRRSGEFIRPESTRDHVVKVFIPGVIRTDWAFIDRVLATMRPWREYTASLQRLYAMEQRWKDAKTAETADELGDRDTEGERRARTLHLPPALEWWFQNYELIRDVATRGYAFHLLTYDRLLRNPRRELEPVLEWLGGGDLDRAVAAVRPELRTQRDVELPEDPRLGPQDMSVFDALYEAVDADRDLPAALIRDMNATHRRLAQRWDDERAQRLAEIQSGTSKS